MEKPMLPRPGHEPKNSWLPITAALLLPVLLVFVAITIIEYNVRKTEGDVVVEMPPPASVAYFTVQLEDAAGNPVIGREVRFVHDLPRLQKADPERSRYEIVKTSDSAGIVTLSVPREGNVTIDVLGREGTEKYKDLELASSERYKLTLVVDRSVAR